MDCRLYYRHISPEDVHYLPDKEQFTGRYRCEIRALDSIKIALEWFVRLSEFEVPRVESFIKECGILRWNWTHEGWGGDARQNYFYMRIADLKDSHNSFLEHWNLASKGKRSDKKIVSNWISEQLAPNPKVESVADWPEMWKTTQTRLWMRAEPRNSGIELQLVTGDLWQALCWKLLEGWKEELIRVCQNPRCTGRKYFLGPTKYCDPYCGKLVADRKYARRVRRLTKKRMIR